jgi:hypothetical protein
VSILIYDGISSGGLIISHEEKPTRKPRVMAVSNPVIFIYSVLSLFLIEYACKISNFGQSIRK